MIATSTSLNLSFSIPPNRYLLHHGTDLHAVGLFAQCRHWHLVVPVGALSPLPKSIIYN